MSPSKDINKENKSFLDITSRIDERVKMIIEKQKDVDDQIKKLVNDFHSVQEKIAIISNDYSKEEIVELRSKISLLETKSESFDTRLSHHDNRWEQIFDAFWKIILMIIAGYILYKLGLQTPPN
jgi:chromosome segregation ATPase